MATGGGAVRRRGDAGKGRGEAPAWRRGETPVRRRGETPVRRRGETPEATGGGASLAGTSNHLTFMPGLAPGSGVRMNISSAPGPAASTMPSEMPKRIFLGVRFATITVSLPTRSCGW